jgi:hypothetical protein
MDSAGNALAYSMAGSLQTTQKQREWPLHFFASA